VFFSENFFDEETHYSDSMHIIVIVCAFIAIHYVCISVHTSIHNDNTVK